MSTLNQVLEDALELSSEQQEMLIKILQNRHYENRRAEIATDAKQTLVDFHTGKISASVSPRCYCSITPVFKRTRGMRLLVLTPKFKRAFRRLVKRNAEL
ncbi:MAG: hypothetical protein V7L31_13975 [Nostoc sp.]|uniref:hypothetical protein n=1 Tax=Nostoc sp. TaxID=1180 RepID=UPI002FF0AC18